MGERNWDKFKQNMEKIQFKDIQKKEEIVIGGLKDSLLGYLMQDKQSKNKR